MRLFLLIITLTITTMNLSAQEDDRVQVPSTNIFMLIPENFSPSENYKGFQHSSDPYSMVMVSEMPAPYAEIVKGFTDEMMAPRGMTLVTKEERRVGIDDGMYVEMLQEANGVVFKKAILIYGDDDKSTFINGMCLEENKDGFAEIAASIKGAVVKTEMVIDQRAELDFSVTEDSLDLKFIGVVANGMLFNRDGLMPTESEDQLNVIIDKSYAEVETGNREQFCITRLAQMPGNYQYQEEKGVSVIEIDGLEARQLEATNAEGETLQQVILFLPEGGYYIFAAMYSEGAEKAREDTSKLLRTFKQK